ncbi:hypothetical protein NP493_3173g00003 [Ridgeia piscesae]|uniref:Homeobox domain-containing protein n=1 Tax=Ridgeia piscesae TaxID=27915 RepID=A0AAD9MYQ9_RIDPI|nr:hypothetical protein NP493_3173g00003 [Ridgeia piscesae]
MKISLAACQLLKQTLFCSWFDSSDNHQRPTVSHIFPVSGPSYNAALLSGAQPMKQPFIRSPADLAAMAASDFMNSPRRERFVFRPNHLEILDRAFQEDSYPSHERREAISKECNAVTEAIVCRPLTDKERVTGQILSNWFANKRKDMKKIAREEGFDISQVPFRSRGRPSRAFCDITAVPMTTAQEQILMNSPPNHSNDSSNGQTMPMSGMELDDTTTATSTHSRNLATAWTVQ